MQGKMNMSKVKWLLVGAGDIANNRVAPALVDAKNSEIIAVCDIREESAHKLADRFNIKMVYTDYAQALAKSDADAVYIATPQSRHVEMCCQALNAGKHFLVEKPLGPNGQECLRLLEAVRKSDRITSCSNYRRLSEQCKATETMMKKQEIGTLVGGWAVYTSPYYNPGKSLGGPIKELGFYIIDIVINLFGMPSDVMAQTSIFTPGRNSEDMASILMKFPGGAIFTIILDWRSNGSGTRHELEFFGSEGRIYWPEWPPHGNGPIFKITHAGTAKYDTQTNPNFHLPMVEDFVDAVLNKRQPVCTIENAVKTEIVTDAIFRSATSSKLEPVIWRD
jgi:predicted dehydrogenase